MKACTYLSSKLYHDKNNETSIGFISSVACCNDKDIIAIASTTGTVTFVDSDGEKVSKNQEIHVGKNGEYLTAILWHDSLGKNNAWLLGGTNNGQIICWSLYGNKDENSDNDLLSAIEHEPAMIYSNAEVHSNEVSMMISNNHQHSIQIRIFTVDVGGVCCVWKMNQDAIMVPLATYDKKSSVTAFVFLRPHDEVHSQQFWFALDNGQIFQGDDKGRFQSVDIEDCTVRIDFILPYNEQNAIVLLTRDSSLIRINIKEGISALAYTKDKLSFTVETQSSPSVIKSAIITSFNHLILAFGENIIRCLNLEDDSHYTLSIPQSDEKYIETAEAVSFDDRNSLLTVGTNLGRFLVWLRSNETESLEKSDGWTIQSICHVDSMFQNIKIFHPPNDELRAKFMIRSNTSVYFLKEKEMHTSYRQGIGAVQIDEMRVVVSSEMHNTYEVIDVGFSISGITNDALYVVIWGEGGIVVYKIDSGGSILLSEIGMTITCLVFNGSTLYIAQDRKLLVTDLSGVQKISIRFPDNEGHPRYLDVAGSHLVVLTDRGVIKVMNIETKEPKIIAESAFSMDAERIIKSIKCNSDGTLISILSDSCWNNRLKRTIHFFDSRNVSIVEANITEVNDVFPISHFWDPVESRLFVGEFVCGDTPKHSSIRVMVMFVDNNGAVTKCYESPQKSSYKGLIGINFPYIYVLEQCFDNTTEKMSEFPVILNHEKIIDFGGLEESSHPEIVSAIVDFYYYITMGDMHMAYMAIENFDDSQLWIKLAQACFKFKNVDVAELCLSKLGHAHGLVSVRRTRQKFANDVALAEVATQLGLLTEAEDLLLNSKRYDLLADLYRKSGVWMKALDVIEEGTIQEQSLHYQYGKYLQEKGELSSSLSYYKKCLCNKSILIKMIQMEIPVQSFLQESHDIGLLKWHASYIESTGDIHEARKLYDIAGDMLGLVRLACLEGNCELAYEIVNKCNDPACSYHLARYFEIQEDYKSAIDVYMHSGLYNHAIRLCKYHNLFEELAAMALKSPIPQMTECAHYLKHKGMFEIAIQLFLKVGDKEEGLKTILQYCTLNDFNLSEEIIHLLEEMSEQIPDSYVERCIGLLIEKKKHELAIKLMMHRGSDVDDLISFCKNNKVLMTANLIENLVGNPANEQIKDPIHISRMNEIANICLEQRNFSVASKIFIQVGDRHNAMKSLMKTGETNSIIAYAKASRIPSVYILGANYLQTLTWHQDVSIIKTIVQFYRKAEAFSQLISFLISWSDDEISHSSYESAHKILEEAMNYGVKMNDWNESSVKNDIQTKIRIIQKFIIARNIVSTDPTNAKNILKEIRQDNEYLVAVQFGDFYSVALEAEHDKMEAVKLIEEMGEKHVHIEKYVSSHRIKEIYEATRT